MHSFAHSRSLSRTTLSHNSLRVDRRGNWHALYHRMFDPAGPLDPNWGKEDGSWDH
jgi:hypothetical protein